MTTVSVEHVREHLMEFLIHLEPLEPFQGPDGVVLFAQLVELVGRCMGLAGAGRHEGAQQAATVLGEFLLEGMPPGVIHDEIEEALAELKSVVSTPLERIH